MVATAVAVVHVAVSTTAAVGAVLVAAATAAALAIVVVYFEIVHQTILFKILRYQQMYILGSL